MPRPLLLLILLALVVAGVILATWSSDPPQGTEDPAPDAPRGRAETGTEQITGDARTPVDDPGRSTPSGKRGRLPRRNDSGQLRD